MCPLFGVLDVGASAAAVNRDTVPRTGLSALAPDPGGTTDDVSLVLRLCWLRAVLASGGCAPASASLPAATAGVGIPASPRADGTELSGLARGSGWDAGSVDAGASTGADVSASAGCDAGSGSVGRDSASCGPAAPSLVEPVLI